MEEKFALLIVPSLKLGHVVLPYIITRDAQSDFYQTGQLVTEDNYKTLVTMYPQDAVKQLLTYISYYDEQTLFNLFAKKKQKAVTVKKFFETLEEETFTGRVRPYIDKQIAHCLEIARKNGIPLYRREDRSNLYPEDFISFEDKQAETLFSFTKEAEVLTYNLQIAIEERNISLFNKYYVILSNDPCYIVIEDRLYHFKDIDGKKLKPFFDKEFVTIPPTFHQKYFEGFILNSIKKYPVQVSGFTIDTIDTGPSFTLTIEQNIAGDQCMQLYCFYNGKRYLYSDKTPFTVLFDAATLTYTKTTRRLGREVEVFGLLAKRLLKKDKYGFLVPSTDISVSQWIAGNKDFLSNQNIAITTNEDKPVDLQLATLTLKISNNKDWFDVDAIVLFGEQEVPFKTIRKLILKGEDQFILPNGNVAIIPQEWFAQYGNLLKMGEEDGDGFKVSELHAGILPKENIEFADKATFEKVAEMGHADDTHIALPQGLSAQLRPYQQEGYQWMYRLYKNGLGACLADDMGLGKTLQTLTMLAKASEEQVVDCSVPSTGTQLSLFDVPEIAHQGKSPASLIVVPASLMHNWANEIQKFLPGKLLFRYYGSNRIPVSQFGEYDFIIITYGLLRNVIDEFATYEFLYAVLDESQSIKNPTSKIYKTVLQLNSVYKLALTGTPIENSLNDLWAQMNFINQGILGNQNFFKTTFLKPIEQNAEVEQDLLKQMVAPFILRRCKQEVATDLPQISEQYLYCAMDDEQSALYEEEKSKARNLIYQSIEESGMGKSSIQILQAITALRQIANHPVLFDSALTIDSGKFGTVCKSLETVLKENHKVLIFSSFVKHLELFEAHLKKNKTRFVKLTGATSNREAVVDEFQNNDDCQVFLISLKAGGVGLNLTAADYVFMLDPWWNPAAEQQAISRAHRIGQEKPVFVYRFISEETIEEKIKTLQEKKAELADVFVNNNTSALNLEDLKLLLT